jgi:hypothetical protein
LCRRIESVGHVIEQSGPADGLEPEELVADQLSRGGKNSLYLKTLPEFTKLFADG